MTVHEEQITRTFRSELMRDGILHEGDSILADQLAILRFLRARNFNRKLAKQLFRECQEWRRSVEGTGIDALYRKVDPFDYPEREAIFQSWPMGFHKTDKLGRPVNIQVPGITTMRQLYKVCSPEKHWEALLVNCESLSRELLPAASRAAGKPIGSAFVIVDLKGFGLEQFWQMKSILRNCLYISQNYYPDTMGKLVIINAPSSFSGIWRVLRQWLTPDTANKIEVLGSDYVGVLLEHIEADNLPSNLGGKCTCTKDGGCRYSNAGPWLEGRALAQARNLKTK